MVPTGGVDRGRGVLEVGVVENVSCMLPLQHCYAKYAQAAQQSLCSVSDGATGDFCSTTNNAIAGQVSVGQWTSDSNAPSPYPTLRGPWHPSRVLIQFGLAGW